MVSEVVVFPDVVEALTTHLRYELTHRGYTLTVATDVPTTRPAKLVRVLRTGGPRHPDPGVPTELAQITVECWAETQAASHDLAQLARAIVHAARGDIEDVLIAKVEEVAGPAHLPDPLSDQERWTFTVQVTVRGATEPAS